MASHKVHPLVALGVAGGSLAGGYLLGKRRLRTRISSPPMMKLTLTVDKVPIVKEIEPGGVILETVEMLVKHLSGTEVNMKSISFKFEEGIILIIERHFGHERLSLSNVWIRVADPNAWQQFTTQKTMTGSLQIEFYNVHEHKSISAILTLSSVHPLSQLGQMLSAN